MAAMHIYAGAWGWSPSLKNSVKTALGLAERAINIDKNLAYSYTVRALCHLYKNDHQKALDEGERALLANPTGGLELVFLGNIQMFAGTPRLAIETILEGFRQTPAYPPWYQCFLGHAKFGIGKFHEAISLLLESLEITPDSILNRFLLVTTYSALGMAKERRAEVEKLLQIDPQFSLERFTSRALPYKYLADLERVRDFAFKAGLPK